MRRSGALQNFKWEIHGHLNKQKDMTGNAKYCKYEVIIFVQRGSCRTIEENFNNNNGKNDRLFMSICLIFRSIAKSDLFMHRK